MVRVRIRSYKLSRFMAFSGLLLSSLISLFAMHSAHATNSIAYHGRIIKPNGSAFEPNSATLVLQIRSTGSEDCLMWEETFSNVNMTGTGGVFSLNLHSGTGTRTDGSGLTFDQVFGNYPTTTMTVPLVNCDGGSNTITLTASSHRIARLKFKDSQMPSYEQTPDMAIAYVPFSMDSQKVGGFTPQNLLRVEDATGPQPAAAFSPADFLELQGLIGGSSAQYEKAGELNGQAIPALSNGNVLSWNGGGWTAVAPLTSETDPNTRAFAKADLPSCNPGEFLTSTGANTWVCAGVSGASGGTVTSITVGSGLVDGSGSTGTNILTTGTIAMPDIVTAGTAAKVTFDAKGRITSTGSLAETDLPTISTAGKVSGSAITTGTITGSTAINTSGNITAATGSLRTLVLRDADTNTVTVQTPADVTADYVLTLPPNDGGAGEVLVTDGSGNLSWAAGGTSSVSNSRQIIAGTGLTGGGDLTADRTLAADFGTGVGKVTQGNDVRLAPAPAVADGGKVLRQNAGGTAYEVVALSTILPTNVVLDGGNTVSATMNVGTNSTHNLQFETGGSPRLTIDTSGQVGIGTATPAANLHVHGTEAIFYKNGFDAFTLEGSPNSDNTGLVLQGGTNTDRGASVTAYGGGHTYGGSVYVDIGDFQAGSPNIGTFQVRNNNNNVRTTQLIVDDTGKTGLGTTTPGTKLDVVGAITSRPNGTSTGQTGQILLRELAASGTDAVTIRARDSFAPYTLTLPVDDGGSGEVLSSDGNGNLSWVSVAGAGAVTSIGAVGSTPNANAGTITSGVLNLQTANTTHPGVVVLAADGGTTASTVVQATDARLTNSRAPSGTASGDLDGTYPGPTVVKIQGEDVDATTPLDTQVMKYVTNKWVPAYINFADLKKADGTPQVVGATCTAGQTMIWSSITDLFTCTDISITAAKISDLDTSVAKIGGNTVTATMDVGTNSNHSMRLETNNVPRVSIDTAGLVAVDGTFQVRNGTTPANYGQILHSGAGGNLFIDSMTGSTYVNWYDGDAFYVGRGDMTNVAIYANSSTGKVGIGNGAPDTALDVKGAITSQPFGTATGEAGQIVLRELAANGTHSAFIRAPDALAANYFLTLPADDGGTGEVLTTDGNGVLSWTAAPAATSVAAGAGTAALPSMSFSGDPNTGFYSSAADKIGVAANGTQIFDFGSGGLKSPTTGAATITTANGTAAAPTFSFTGDEDTGWFRPLADTLAAATAGVERVRIDSSGNVGVGTTSSGSKVEIKGTASNSVPIVRVTDGTVQFDQYIGTGASAGGNWGTTSNDNMFIFTNWFNRMAINKAGGVSIGDTSFMGTAPPVDGLTIKGSVGIGTTNPTAKLTVGSQTSVQSTTGIALGLDQNSIEYVTAYSGNGHGFKIAGEDPGGGTFLRIKGRSNSTTWNNLVSISDTGNVGLGSAIPAAKLDVMAGAVRSTRAGAQYVELFGGDSGSFTDTYLRSHQSEGNKKPLVISTLHDSTGAAGGTHYISFETGAASAPTEHVRITSGGNVGIGTPTPGTKLDVSGAIRGTSMYVNGTNFSINNDGVNSSIINSTGAQLWYNSVGTSSTSVAYRYHVTSSNTPALDILNNGNVGIGTTTPAALLDVNGTARFGGGLNAKVRVVTAAGAITVTTSDYIICVNKSSGAATTINLPASPALGDQYVIKDCKGDAATNNITVTPNAGNIDGAGTYVLNINRQSAGIFYDGTQWQVF